MKTDLCDLYIKEQTELVKQGRKSHFVESKIESMQETHLLFSLLSILRVSNTPSSVKKRLIKQIEKEFF